MKKNLNDGVLLSSFFDETVKTDPIISSSYDDALKSSFMDDTPETDLHVISHETDNTSTSTSSEPASVSNQGGLVEVPRYELVGPFISSLFEESSPINIEPSGSDSFKRSRRESLGCLLGLMTM